MSNAIVWMLELSAGWLSVIWKYPSSSSWLDPSRLMEQDRQCPTGGSESSDFLGPHLMDVSFSESKLPFIYCIFPARDGKKGSSSNHGVYPYSPPEWMKGDFVYSRDICNHVTLNLTALLSLLLLFSFLTSMKTHLPHLLSHLPH